MVGSGDRFICRSGPEWTFRGCSSMHFFVSPRGQSSTTRSAFVAGTPSLENCSTSGRGSKIPSWPWVRSSGRCWSFSSSERTRRSIRTYSFRATGRSISGPWPVHCVSRKRSLPAARGAGKIEMLSNKSKKLKWILALGKYLGLFPLARLLTRKQLRIVCYHGTAIANEAVFRRAWLEDLHIQTATTCDVGLNDSHAPVGAQARLRLFGRLLD